MKFPYPKEPVFAECRNCKFRGMPKKLNCHHCGSHNFDIWDLPDELFKTSDEKTRVGIVGFLAMAYYLFGPQEEVEV